MYFMLDETAGKIGSQAATVRAPLGCRCTQSKADETNKKTFL